MSFAGKLLQRFSLTFFNYDPILKGQYKATSLLLFMVLLLFVLYWLIKFSSQNFHIIRALGKIPGPPALPVIGNIQVVFITRENIPKAISWWLQMYGTIYRIWIFFVPVVIVAKAEYAESIFNNAKNIEKSFFYRLMEPWLGSGLLTSKGNKWFVRRKMITPAFHFNILGDFMEVFVKNGDILIKKLKKYENAEAFGITAIISANTLDNICETAMGVSVNAQENYDGKYVKAINSVNQTILNRIPRAWLWPDICFWMSPSGREFYRNIKMIHAFTTKVIQERRASFLASPLPEDDPEKGKKKKLAFLDLLMHSSQQSVTPMTDSDFSEEVDTFMFEGYDTTASALTWALFRLGNHPDYQARCVEELQEIFSDPESDRSERTTSMNDLSKMKYLEQFIKEVLRHYPSVPVIGRKLGTDSPCGKYIIPAGTNVAVSIYDLHRDVEQFPNPNEFNPDHFSSENIGRRHPYAYIPFSAGPRNCIGQKFALLQMKVTLSMILRNFIIEAVQTPEDLNITFELILRYEPDIKIKLRRREPCF